MTERVVLASSGGLDTSVAIGWIAEETGAEVIVVAVEVGQGGEDLAVIRKRALACGAVEAEVAVAKDEFAREYCLPAIKANAPCQRVAVRLQPRHLRLGRHLRPVRGAGLRRDLRPLVEDRRPT